MQKSDEKIVEYLPVDGCEECEFMETACAECIAYGEAEKVEANNA